MNYRFAEEKDRNVIMNLLDLSFDSAYAYYAQKSFTSMKDSMVAEENCTVVGVINWKIYNVDGEKMGYLFWVAVHPDHRRKGIGEALILGAINSIQVEVGSSDIYSAVDKHNAPMRKLFEKMGFTPDGRIVTKKKLGMRRLQLYSRMMLMPWEDLFIKSKNR